MAREGNMDDSLSEKAVPLKRERGGRDDKCVWLMTAVCLLVALCLVSGGPFVFQWALPANLTVSNISYSLWQSKQCFTMRCTTTLETKPVSVEECDLNGICRTSSTYLSRNITECVEVFYCNIIFITQDDPSNVPSILWVGMAFETPAMVTGLVALVLYVVKIILNWREPKKRLHLKAAYLTFAALAGAAAEFGVIIFCAMLEKDKLTLGWAPALCGVGGFLQLSMALGGYMGWRSVSTDTEEFEEDDISLTEKFVDSRPQKKKPKTFFGRSISNTSTGSGITKL